MRSTIKKIIKDNRYIYRCVMFIRERIDYLLNKKYFRARLGYRTLINKLARHIVKNRMSGGMLLQESGEFYVSMPDHIFLYYNLDYAYTLGDGQCCDFLDGNPAIPLDSFLKELLTEDSVYFDVGANNGYFYSLRVARWFPRCSIFAFEPDPKILFHLKKNIAINNATNIRLVPQALLDNSGCSFMTSGLGESNFIVDSKKSTYSTIEVPCVSLDNFVLQNSISRIDVIKADIEGSEYKLLLGSEQSLLKFRPLVILELNGEFLKRNKASLDEVLVFLKRVRYTCKRFSGTNDFLAIPQEKTGLAYLANRTFLENI